MTLRLILRYNETPSHSLIITTFWIRLLVETEAPSGAGHVIGNVVSLRKSTNALNIITGIEVEQLQGDPTQAQRYLDACDWWLHRAPFGVERLPLAIVARAVVHGYPHSTVRVAGSCITRVDVSDLHPPCRLPPRLLAVDQLRPFFSHLRELNLSNRSYPGLEHLRGARELVSLNINGCVCVGNLAPLRQCGHLRELYASRTSVSNLDVLQCFPELEVLHCGENGRIRDLSVLRRCRRLRELYVSGTNVRDLSPLGGLPHLTTLTACHCAITDFRGLDACASLKWLSIAHCRGVSRAWTADRWPPPLEVFDAAFTGIAALPASSRCVNVRVVTVSSCQYLYDLSSLSGAQSLESINAGKSGAATLTGLNMCFHLRSVDFRDCPHITNLLGLAGAPSLQAICASGSALDTVAGLSTCLKLETVDVSRCLFLTDLSGLSGTPSLRTVYARGASIAVIGNLARTPTLATLDLRDTPSEGLTRLP